MCYSALVRNNLQWLERMYGAEAAWEVFEELFGRRLTDDSVKLSRGLEANFDRPQSPIQQRTKEHIDQYRARSITKWEQELFAQKKRLADAQRSLTKKETKAAHEGVRIATNKIQTLIERLTAARRTELRELDNRIFPMSYAPVILQVGDRRIIRPMRYTCRLAGKPADYDRRFPGAYNARRDNLSGFWSASYGRNHGILVVDSFFENVPRHVYEKRELAPGEAESNMVLHFNPRVADPMTIACLWSRWTGPGEPDLESFASVTDDPPPEISATGHTRCIISLKSGNVAEWLSPSQVTQGRLEEILGDHVEPCYEHRIAA